jgi:hypothetical protein
LEEVEAILCGVEKYSRRRVVDKELCKTGGSHGEDWRSKRRNLRLEYNMKETIALMDFLGVRSIVSRLPLNIVLLNEEWKREVLNVANPISSHVESTSNERDQHVAESDTDMENEEMKQNCIYSFT